MNASAALRASGGKATIFAPDYREESYWWEGMPKVPRSPKTLLRSVDVAIVGGGVTGLNAALELIRAGKNVAVFDAGEFGLGASSRNTGFLGRFLKKSLAELMATDGASKAIAYYSELYQALNVSMRDVIEREAIDCDFEICGRVVLARSSSQLKAVVDEFALRAKHLGEQIESLGQAELQREIRCSDHFVGGVLIPDMASIHPGKYHAGLLSAAEKLGVATYANARVSNITPGSGQFEVETSLGSLLARDVIIATNGYTRNDLRWFARRLVPFQGFAIATEETDPERLRRLMPTGRSYTDADFDTMAIRLTPDGRRIITSGRTGKGMPLCTKAELLHRDLVSVFPSLNDVKVSYAWSGYCAAPLDTMPKIGRRDDGLWYATGFTFMGMPQGSYFGRKVALQVLGDPKGATVYSGEPFKSSPFYNGTPWFLSPFMSAMRARDSLSNRRSKL